MHGGFLINGLRNRDLCALLYPRGPADAAEQRRRSAAVTRKLRMLRAHGLLHKVPHTHRMATTWTYRHPLRRLRACHEAGQASGLPYDRLAFAARPKPRAMLLPPVRGQLTNGRTRIVVCHLAEAVAQIDKGLRGDLADRGGAHGAVNILAEPA
jgi:hypothetical protein